MRRPSPSILGPSTRRSGFARTMPSKSSLELANIYGEPFADSSQIPTLLLCREARKHVTVALTGDGGDEIFGGYNRHVLAPQIWSRASRVPTPLLGSVGAVVWPIAIGAITLSLHRRNRLVRRLADKAGLSAFGPQQGRPVRRDYCRKQRIARPDVYFGLTRHCDDHPGRFLRTKVITDGSRRTGRSWENWSRQNA